VRFAEEEEVKEIEQPKKGFLFSLGGEDNWNVIDLPTFDDKGIGETNGPVKRTSCWACFSMHPQSDTLRSPQLPGKVSSKSA
jgi:hypothetical protein